MDVFRRLKARLRIRRAQAELSHRKVQARPHGLPAALYVSLTSYPARFDVLHLTLLCLLQQTVRPDGVILWLGHGDEAKLPPAVTQLVERGLHIRTHDDLRSYTKIVPMLSEKPDAFIVTADDDHYYTSDWLEGLVTTSLAHPDQVIGHRNHRITYAPDGSMKSYELWEKNIGGAVAGSDIFATGVGGVLYPPGCLHPDTTRVDLFKALAPHADDVWLYWMARRQGTLIRHVGPRTRIMEWPGSQQQNLRSINRGAPGETGNDLAIAAMTAHFGRPL